MVEDVNLLNSPAEGGSGGPSMLSAGQNVMQSSSSSSGSSISVNFRFVHPVAGQPGHYSDSAGRYPSQCVCVLCGSEYCHKQY